MLICLTISHLHLNFFPIQALILSRTWPSGCGQIDTICHRIRRRIRNLIRDLKKNLRLKCWFLITFGSVDFLISNTETAAYNLAIWCSITFVRNQKLLRRQKKDNVYNGSYNDITFYYVSPVGKNIHVISKYCFIRLYLMR